MEKRTFLLILLVLMPVFNHTGLYPQTVPLQGDASEFFEYERIYTPGPEIELYAGHIREYLDKIREKSKKDPTLKRVEARIRFYKDAYHGETAQQQMDGILKEIQEKIPADSIPGEAALTFLSGSGWYSPLDDIGYMLILETTLPTQGKYLTLKRYFQDLVNLKDLSLRGRIGEFKVEFPVPRDGELLDSSHAFIRFEHSAMLDPRKSSLGLFLNYRGLTTVRLDAANVYGGQLKQPFPLYQVRDFNVLTVTAGQLLEIECTPPFDPALWTSVCGDSYLYLSYFLHQVKPDLAWFPYPFHDVRQPLPEPIYFLSTPGMDHELFSRYLELAFYFGTVFGWHRGDICWIESLDQWGSGPLVVAGTSAVPLIREWTREFQGQPSPLAKNTPALLKFFLLAQKPVLLISGNTTEEVHHAFDALLQTAPAKLLNSSSATIKEIHRKDPDLQRFLLGKIEPRSIGFKELGIDDFTLRGSDGQEKTLEIPLLFGTSIPEHEAYMELVYSYSAQNNTDISNIEIRTNQVPFSSIPLMERKGVTLDKESLQVPHHLINGPFRLSFYGHFYPVIIDPCRWTPLDAHWFTVFSTSRLTIPRDVYLKMPELKWLRLWGYPFVDNPDSDTVRIEYEDRGNVREAALNLAFFLGQKARLFPLNFEASALKDTKKTVVSTAADSHVIRLFTDFSPQEKAFGKLNPLLKQDEFDKYLSDGTGPHRIKTQRIVGAYEEIPLPGREKILLSIHSPAPKNFKWVIKTLSDSHTLDTFAGAAVTVDAVKGDLLVKSFPPRKQYQWGEFSMGRKAKRFFLDHMLYIFLLVPVLVLLLYILVRIIKRFILKRKQSRADNENEEKGELDAVKKET